MNVNELLDGQDLFQRTTPERRVQQNQVELLMAGREVAGRLANVDPAAVKHAAVFAVFHHDVHDIKLRKQEL